MIGTDELEVRRLVHGLDVATFAQRAAVAATRAERGHPPRDEDSVALHRVRSLINYVLEPVPSAPRAQAAHALTAQPGTEEILRAEEGDAGRRRLEQMRDAVDRLLGGQELSDEDRGQLRELRKMFLGIGRMNLRHATEARLEREARPGGVA
jgi:hypothetical protein